MVNTCVVLNCVKFVHGHGYCRKHYICWKRTGDPISKMTLPIVDRFWNKVDKSAGDGCWLWTATTRNSKSGKTYSSFWDGKKMGHAARWIYAEGNGPIPAGMQIDHTCHNTLCVKPAHLQAVTQKQNKENTASAYTRSATGVRGVFPSSDGKKYVGQVRHNKVLHHVGTFTTVAEAEVAVIAKRNELFTNNLVDRRS